MEIFIGHDSDTRPVHWNTNTDPHLALSGSTGSGMSVLARHIAYEALEQADVYVIDTSKNLTDYTGLSALTSMVTSSTDGAVALLEHLTNLVTTRYRNNSRSNGTASYRPVVVIHDGYTSYEGDDSPEAHKIAVLTTYLLSCGAGAGVHMVLVGQRFTARYNSSVHQNASFIVMGSVSTRMHDFYLGENAPTVTSDDKRGTGVFSSRSGESIKVSVPYRH